MTITLAEAATTTFNVFFDWMVLEKDLSKPMVYLSTSGAALDYSTEQKLMTAIKVCPEHRERLTLESYQFGKSRLRREVELPVPIDIQGRDFRDA